MADETRDELAEDASEDLELDDEASGNVTGGMTVTLGDIKGESMDAKHKDEIEI
jgi:hypothetical protein